MKKFLAICAAIAPLFGAAFPDEPTRYEEVDQIEGCRPGSLIATTIENGKEIKKTIETNCDSRYVKIMEIKRYQGEEVEIAKKINWDKTEKGKPLYAFRAENGKQIVVTDANVAMVVWVLNADDTIDFYVDYPNWFEVDRETKSIYCADDGTQNEKFVGEMLRCDGKENGLKIYDRGEDFGAIVTRNGKTEIWKGVKGSKSGTEDFAALSCRENIDGDDYCAPVEQQ